MGVSTVETTSVRKSNSLEENFEFGQKNISTLQRNLMNADEILRLPSNKLTVNLRGYKPLLLNKIRYTEHPLAERLKDTSIYEYIPTWTKNTSVDNIIKKENKKPVQKKKKIGFDNF